MTSAEHASACRALLESALGAPALPAPAPPCLVAEAYAIAQDLRLPGFAGLCLPYFAGLAVAEARQGD